MFRIDDKYYNVDFLSKDGLGQTADILDGDNSGRLQTTGAMYLDYLGTFFNHSIKLRRNINCSDEEWNNLFLALANPIHEHNIDVPFGNGILTLDIYVSQVKRNLIKVDFGQDGRLNHWEKTIEFTATALKSNWLAGGNLTGYKES